MRKMKTTTAVGINEVKSPKGKQYLADTVSPKQGIDPTQIEMPRYVQTNQFEMQPITKPDALPLIKSEKMRLSQQLSDNRHRSNSGYIDSANLKKSGTTRAYLYQSNNTRQANHMTHQHHSSELKDSIQTSESTKPSVLH